MPQLKVTYPEDLEGKDGFVSLGKVSGSGPWVPWVASGGRKWWEQHVIFIWLLLLLLFCPYYRLSVFLWYWHLFPAKAHKHSTEVVQIILRNDGTRAWPEDLSVAPIHHLRCINPQYDQLGMMLWPVKEKNGTWYSNFLFRLRSPSYISSMWNPPNEPNFREDCALTCCFGSGFGCARLPMDSVQPGEAMGNFPESEKKSVKTKHMKFDFFLKGCTTFSLIFLYSIFWIVFFLQTWIKCVGNGLHFFFQNASESRVIASRASTFAWSWKRRRGLECFVIHFISQCWYI